VKTLTTSLPATLAIGGIAASMVLVLPWAKENASAWLLGSLVAAILGAIVLVVKLQFTSFGLTGTAAIKAVITAQVIGFFLRLVGVGVGVLAMKQNELSLFAFVVPFFVVSLSQQVLETRSLLSRGPAKPPVKSSEVTP
jgi:hypothetical protein